MVNHQNLFTKGFAGSRQLEVPISTKLAAIAGGLNTVYGRKINDKIALQSLALAPK